MRLERKFLFLLVVCSAVAAPAATPPVERFTVAYRLGLNISAEFTDTVGFPSSGVIGAPTGGGVNRTYDDGFNHVDVTGNAGGQTWNWGYNDASQVPGNDTVTMSSTVINPAPTSRIEDDPHNGFEIGYYRQCGTIGPARWGIEAAGGWMNLNFRDTGNLIAATTRTVDAYALADVIAPVAPYAGTFAGPGPLVGDSPSRSVVTGAASVGGQRELDARLFSARIGPALELPLAPTLTLNLSGGFAVAYIEGEFNFAETATLPGASPRMRSANDTKSDALVGYYLAGGLAWEFAPRWSVFAAGQFVHTQDYAITAGVRAVALRLGQGVFVTVGLGFSF